MLKAMEYVRLFMHDNKTEHDIIYPIDRKEEIISQRMREWFYKEQFLIRELFLVLWIDIGEVDPRMVDIMTEEEPKVHDDKHYIILNFCAS